jgi:Protein of unknown function (DUF3800)
MEKKKIYNIYSDESCHLQNDKQTVMCLGYTKIESSTYLALKDKIKVIKFKHNSPTELKWNTLSGSRIDLYKELIDFFFENEIEFRCMLIKNKQKLDHNQFNEGDSDNFYYKSIYYLLNNPFVNPTTNQYRTYLDIKDTRGKSRLKKIEEVLQNKHQGESPFIYFQHIHSHENEFIQLADLFMGAISYKARGEQLKPEASKVKKEVIEYLEAKSGYNISEGTEPWEAKFNIFEFQPKSISK